MGKVWLILRTTWRKWRDDQATRQGAGLAFYALFSIAPVLVLVTWIASPFFGEYVIVDHREFQLGALMPPEMVQTTEEMISSASGSKRSLFVAMLVMLYAPYRGFTQLQSTLNDTWGVRAVRGPGPLNMIRRKGMAFASVALTAALLFVSVLVNGVLLTVSAQATQHFEVPVWLEMMSGWFTSFVLIFMLLVVIYKTLPDVTIAWRNVFIGAIFTTALLVIGQELIAVYLQGSNRVMLFGAAGSIVAILLFTYYSAQVLLFGASFTYVYANESGAPIEPSVGAVKIVKTPIEGESSS
jgi:membrane protein